MHWCHRLEPSENVYLNSKQHINIHFVPLFIAMYTWFFSFSSTIFSLSICILQLGGYCLSAGKDNFVCFRWNLSILSLPCCVCVYNKHQMMRVQGERRKKIKKEREWMDKKPCVCTYFPFILSPQTHIKCLFISISKWVRWTWAICLANARIFIACHCKRDSSEFID